MSDMAKEINDRLAALRAQMKTEGIDAYLVVTDDFHASEYVGDYFKCRAFLSGFDGSAGTVVVTMDEAGLWTDGRYFLQAEDQLAGTEITLYRMGEEGVPEIEKFLKKKLKAGQTLGFDGRTVSSRFFQKLRGELGDEIKIRMENDLIDRIWTDRPAMSAQPVWILDPTYSGESTKERLSRIRSLLKEKADMTVIASLDDIAWLLNIRGNDVAFNPVVLSYLILSQTEVLLFINEKTLDEKVRTSLEKDGVKICDYNAFYQALKEIPGGTRVWVDPSRMNASAMSILTADKCVLEGDNLTLLPKAVKNKTEVANEKEAHIKDGVAVTRFIYWLKHHIGKEPITELTVTQKLDEFRQMGEHYLGQSFDPIAAYGAHGAIVHYEPTSETDIPLQAENFLLLDTGGQYLEGTTDITRTIALGMLTDEQKKYYTAVLRGNLNLAAAKFKYGCHGINVDYLAREPLWEMNMDYNHGTGHGVGYLLNVHEGPNSIRYKELSPHPENQVLEEGMITSDEPGLYLTGKYGIRIENLMACKKSAKNEYGQFMEFETLTLVPYEVDAIEPTLMAPKEIERLNAYHERVYNTISPYLTGDEKEWLYRVTRPMHV